MKCVMVLPEEGQGGLSNTNKLGFILRGEQDIQHPDLNKEVEDKLAPKCF